mgnify:CR=1 FL=1
MQTADRIIIGAGIYGLYAALQCSKRGEKVVVLEFDEMAFSRATHINQARVHNGYHYPRSFSTAIHSQRYYERFNSDYDFCINKKFDKIYATANRYSWTEANQFKNFCKAANIKCDRMDLAAYFKSETCEEAFLTEECTYDAMQLKDFFLKELAKFSKCEILYGARIESIKKGESTYQFQLESQQIESPFVLNATYASVNQILEKLQYESFNIKYELCEIILCTVSENLKNTGVTMMDGPFFSLMPFGNTGYHSLSAVPYTPHKVSTEKLPTFDCQSPEVNCSPAQLNNCNLCANQPKTSWHFMYNLAKKYLNDNVEIQSLNLNINLSAHDGGFQNELLA